jgi:hypothetical protein
MAAKRALDTPRWVDYKRAAPGRRRRGSAPCHRARRSSINAIARELGVRTDRVAGMALAALGLYVLWESRALPLGTLSNPGPAYLPTVLAVLVILFGTALAAAGALSPPIQGLGWGEARRALVIVAACALAALLLERLGYRVTMGALVLFLVGVVERRHPLFALGFSVALSALSYLVFATLLRVPLPRGPFGI